MNDTITQIVNDKSHRSKDTSFTSRSRNRFELPKIRSVVALETINDRAVFHTFILDT